MLFLDKNVVLILFEFITLFFFCLNFLDPLPFCFIFSIKQFHILISVFFFHILISLKVNNDVKIMTTSEELTNKNGSVILTKKKNQSRTKFEQPSFEIT